MKLSLCIPQYNRIIFLQKNLDWIAQQNYPNLEVIVSDDCSTDDTEKIISEKIPKYPYPLIYHRFHVNQGYDRNFRRCMELASGDYCIVLGNDDSINPQYDLSNLCDLLEKWNRPELGFSNYLEEANGQIFKRATQTGLLGTGPEVAFKNYSCFSFVAGIIFRRDAFLKYNTDRYDGSIFAQIYLATYMTSLGCRLFSIEDPMVVKDIVIDGLERNSYKDTLARSWKEYKKVDGGLPSVIHVLFAAFKDAEKSTPALRYKVFKKIYTTTVPFWILDYKKNGAFPEAVGLFRGIKPKLVNHFDELSPFEQFKINLRYWATSFGAFVFPAVLLDKLKNSLYNWTKR